MIERFVAYGIAAVVVIVVGGFWSGAALGAKVPLWVPVAPTGLAIRFNLSADWGVTNHASLDKGWKWEGFSPGQAAWVRLTTLSTSQGFAQIKGAFVKDVRASTKKAVEADPAGFFRSSQTRIANTPAVKLVIHARAFTAFGPAETTTVNYAFVRGGVFYEIEFDTPDQYLGKFLPTLTRIIETTRFVQIS